MLSPAPTTPPSASCTLTPTPLPEGEELKAAATAEAARTLNELRENWLNPPQWVDRVPEVVPGYPDCLIPKPEHTTKLRQRTLTNLYNQRPAWLVNAHRALDEAVAAAYGWPADLSDDEVLHRLLALNRERALEDTPVPALLKIYFIRAWGGFKVILWPGATAAESVERIKNPFWFNFDGRKRDPTCTA